MFVCLFVVLIVKIWRDFFVLFLLLSIYYYYFFFSSHVFGADAV